MKLDSQRVLLYIEPSGNKEPPVIDKFSVKIFNGMSPIHFEIKKEYMGTIGNMHRKPVFTPGIYTMGHHECVCGATSTGYDILLDDGKSQIITNMLALHYLVYHRSEVPESELTKIGNLNFSITLDEKDMEKFNTLAQR